MVLIIVCVAPYVALGLLLKFDPANLRGGKS